MKRNEILEWLARHGYKASGRSPALFYNDAKPRRRYRFAERVLRLEIQSLGGHWFRSRSGYTNRLTIGEHDELKGMQP